MASTAALVPGAPVQRFNDAVQSHRFTIWLFWRGGW